MTWILQNVGPLKKKRHTLRTQCGAVSCFQSPGLKSSSYCFLAHLMNHQILFLFFSLSTSPLRSPSWDVIRRGGGTAQPWSAEVRIHSDFASRLDAADKTLVPPLPVLRHLTLYNSHVQFMTRYCLVSRSGLRNITMTSSACLFSDLTVSLLEPPDRVIIDTRATVWWRSARSVGATASDSLWWQKKKYLWHANYCGLTGITVHYLGYTAMETHWFCCSALILAPYSQKKKNLQCFVKTQPLHV